MWFVMTKLTTSNDDEYTFYNVYGMSELTAMENTAIVTYFMFTTMSTVGFGDFNPKSEIERVIMTFILIIGVTCFAYIMSQLIEILLVVQSITAENEEGEDVSRWILLL